MKTLNEYRELAEQSVPPGTLTRERKINIKASKDFLHESIHNFIDPDIKEAVTILVGKRGKKTDWMEDIVCHLIESGSIDEDIIFIEHKKGRHEMKQVIKYAKEKGVSIELIDGEYIVNDLLKDLLDV